MIFGGFVFARNVRLSEAKPNALATGCMHIFGKQTLNPEILRP